MTISFLSFFRKVASVSIITSVVILLTNMTLSLTMLDGDYGLYAYYYNLYQLLLNIIPFGTAMAIVVFANKKEKFKNILINAILYLIPFTTSLLIFSIYLLPVSWVPDKNNLVAVVFLSLGGSLCFLTISYYRSIQDFIKYRSYYILFTVFFSFVSLAAYVTTKSIHDTFQILSISVLFLSVVFIYSLKVDEKLKVKKFSYIRFFRYLKYGLPVVLSSIGMSLLIIGDKIILGSIINKDELTSYSIASLISSTTLFLVNNYAAAWGIHITKTISKLTGEAIYFNFINNLKKGWVILPIGVMVILFQIVIYYYFYKENFPRMEALIISLSSAYLLLGLSKFLMGYLNYYSKNFTIFTSSLIAISISITIFFAFYEEGGYKWMGLSILSGMLSQLIFLFYFTSSMLRRAIK